MESEIAKMTAPEDKNNKILPNK